MASVKDASFPAFPQLRPRWRALAHALVYGRAPCLYKTWVKFEKIHDAQAVRRLCGALVRETMRHIWSRVRPSKCNTRRQRWKAIQKRYRTGSKHLIRDKGILPNEVAVLFRRELFFFFNVPPFQFTDSQESKHANSNYCKCILHWCLCLGDICWSRAVSLLCVSSRLGSSTFQISFPSVLTTAIVPKIVQVLCQFGLVRCLFYFCLIMQVDVLGFFLHLNKLKNLILHDVLSTLYLNIILALIR